MDITTLTMPNLIVNDLLLVKPMSSISGFLTYLKFGLGTEKGGVGGRNADGTLKTIVQNESPFVWGAMSEDRARYTGEAVVEAAKAGTDAQALAWLVNGDLVHGVFEHEGVKYDVKLVKAGAADIFGFYKAADKKFYSDAALTTQITVAADTKVAYKYDNVTVPQAKLPTLVGQMDSITLQAKARRIAVYYSQIAAFQA